MEYTITAIICVALGYALREYTAKKEMERVQTSTAGTILTLERTLETHVGMTAQRLNYVPVKMEEKETPAQGVYQAKPTGFLDRRKMAIENEAAKQEKHQT